MGKINNLSVKNLLIILTIAVLITDLAIFLDIPLLRQIFGFLFLTLLPGLLILQILKLNRIGYTEKLVLCVGISISFLMFFGLFLNNLSLGLGYERPLSTISLLISLNLIFVSLGVIGYKINKNSVVSLPNFNLTTLEKAFLIVPILFPALSIFGMRVMNTTDNNIILMLLLFLIPAYVVFVCFFNYKFPKRLYPIVIFLISISLLLIYTLRFSHIFGADIHIEYYFFRVTSNNMHWCITSPGSSLDACLSISLLPAIFQSILGVNAQEYLFRGIYLSICSFGPLAIYIISKKYIGELYAFIASFFFMAQPTFLCAPISPRTNVAIFFAALAVMVFFSDKISPLKRKSIFIVFMLSITVSHYATTYIFFFIILSSWFVVEIISKRHSFEKRITLTFVLIFFASIFLWYSQVTETAFSSGVGFLEATFSKLNEFFLEESRAPSLRGLAGEGLLSHELTYPILSRAYWVVTWCTFITIGVGVLTMLKRYKEMVSISISNGKCKKPDFLKTKFEMEYLTMAVSCVGVLIVMIVIPYVSVGYQLERLYSLTVIILSVCFIIGGVTLSHFFFFYKKRKPVLKEKNNGLQNRAYLVILLILIPHFLFQTGAMDQLFGVPRSFTLNSGGVYKEQYDRKYVHDQESCAAKWLKSYAEKSVRLYTADGDSALKLISQGEFSPHLTDCRSFYISRRARGYLYLGYNNIVNGKFSTEKGVVNRSNYADISIRKNKIYNNIGSEIYK